MSLNRFILRAICVRNAAWRVASDHMPDVTEKILIMPNT